MDDLNAPAHRVAAPPDPSGITALLRRAGAGDRSALDSVYAALYPELKKIARARLRQQGRGRDLGTTTLLHEGFVRLVSASGWQIQDRRHFFAYTAKAMRHIIIDSAREHLSQRRGGAAEHVPLHDAQDLHLIAARTDSDLLNLHEALRALELVDPSLAELVEMRYFGGYSEVEIAQLQGVTTRTLQRHWEKARAWIYLALQRD
jgi:RNA polymerase sigma factor (TIGR02999 family)